jgi:hypothetical protein
VFECSTASLFKVTSIWGLFWALKVLFINWFCIWSHSLYISESRVITYICSLGLYSLFPIKRWTEVADQSQTIDCLFVWVAALPLQSKQGASEVMDTCLHPALELRMPDGTATSKTLIHTHWDLVYQAAHNMSRHKLVYALKFHHRFNFPWITKFHHRFNLPMCQLLELQYCLL